MYLALMIHRFIQAENDRTSVDDCDYYGDKHMELAGSLLLLLFEDFFKRNIFEFEGNWTIKRFRMERQSVTQMLNSLCCISGLGMMARVNSPFDSRRHVKCLSRFLFNLLNEVCYVRQMHLKKSLVRNLPLMTHIITKTEEKPIVWIAQNKGVENINQWQTAQRPEYNSVFLNGKILGLVKDYQRMIRYLKLVRRIGYIINALVSIHPHFLTRAVYISCGGCRLCRDDNLESNVTAYYF